MLLRSAGKEVSDVRTKCAMCGRTTETPYIFERVSYAFGYKLYLCEVCGAKIKKIIDEGKKDE